jgi:hypothetical protein
MMFVFAVVGSAQSVLYFPQIADGVVGPQAPGGGQWLTAIVLTNTSTASATGSITFTQDNGTAFNVPFVDLISGAPVNSGNTLNFQLGPGQTNFYQSTGKQPITVGFATITSNIPVTATVNFTEGSWVPVTQSPSTGSYANIGTGNAPAAGAALRQGTYAIEAGNVDVGVAFANPNSTGASVTFRFVANNGNQPFSAVSVNLGPNNHTAKFISQLFPSAVGSLGTLQVISTQPLAMTALFFNTQSGLFTTLPVFPLP